MREKWFVHVKRVIVIRWGELRCFLFGHLKTHDTAYTDTYYCGRCYEHWVENTVRRPHYLYEAAVQAERHMTEIGVSHEYPVMKYIRSAIDRYEAQGGTSDAQ